MPHTAIKQTYLTERVRIARVHAGNELSLHLFVFFAPADFEVIDAGFGVDQIHAQTTRHARPEVFRLNNQRLSMRHSPSKISH